MVISELGVTEGDGRTPELDRWAVSWAVILETWVRDGGVLEGSKGWDWSPLGLPGFSEFGKSDGEFSGIGP